MNLSIYFYIIVGFIAQMIDGALGMAYGVSSTSLLLGMGSRREQPVRASMLRIGDDRRLRGLPPQVRQRRQGASQEINDSGHHRGAIGAYILSELEGKC